MIEIIIPHFMFKYLTFKDCTVARFKSEWKNLQSRILRSPVFEINDKIVRSAKEFQHYFNGFQVLNDHKSDEYHAGMDEMKLGAIGFLKDHDWTVFLRIIFKPNNQAYIQAVSHDNEWLPWKSEIYIDPSIQRLIK